MITNYFDENVRLVVTTPGNLQPVGAQRWVYGDNYNLAVYVLNGGITQPISIGDTLTAILFQTTATLPAQNLAIISPPVVQTDATNNQYFSLNVNLKTTAVAALVQQGTATTATALFRLIFSPADGERFSASQDIQVTLISDPTVGASGATPIPPGYPVDPSVFERIANRGIASGYATLDSTGHVPVAQIPPSTLSGDMLKSIYDTNNNGIVDTCDTLQISRVVGLGSAATHDVPASGNASTAQVVMGDDTRLADQRPPIAHQTTHNGGSDAIPLVTPSGQGLCPPIDGTTIQIAGGKLVATTTGSGDMLKSVYATNNPLNTTGVVDNALSIQTHQIPTTGDASGAQIVLATDSRLTNARTPTGHQATHNGGSDAIPLASAAAAGLCPMVDNTTIQVVSSKLAAMLATASAPGIVRPDNTSITISGGIISAVAGGLNVNARVHATVVQTLSATPNTALAVIHSTVDFQNGGTFWTSGNPSQLVIPAGQAGTYLYGGQLSFDASATGTRRQVYIRQTGGAGIVSISTVAGGTAGSWYPTGCVSGIAHFNVADYIELMFIADVASLGNIVPSNGGPCLWLARIA